MTICDICKSEDIVNIGYFRRNGLIDVDFCAVHKKEFINYTRQLIKNHDKKLSGLLKKSLANFIDKER